MTAGIQKECAVCAWRATCSKKHTIRETSVHCPDFTRDLALGSGEEAESPVVQHKNVEDVFGKRK